MNHSVSVLLVLTAFALFLSIPVAFAGDSSSGGNGGSASILSTVASATTVDDCVPPEIVPADATEDLPVPTELDRPVTSATTATVSSVTTHDQKWLAQALARVCAEEKWMGVFDLHSGECNQPEYIVNPSLMK